MLLSTRRSVSPVAGSEGTVVVGGVVVVVVGVGVVVVVVAGVLGKELTFKERGTNFSESGTVRVASGRLSNCPSSKNASISPVFLLSRLQFESTIKAASSQFLCCIASPKSTCHVFLPSIEELKTFGP